MSQPDKQPPANPLTAVAFRDSVRLGVSDAKSWRLHPEVGANRYTARLTQFGVRFDPVGGGRAITVPLGNVISVEHDA